MKIKLYNLETLSKTKLLFQKKIDKLIKTSDWILGDEVEQFENNLKSYIGSKYALGRKFRN
jgi:dTDP-4-amino-4,6-dideoxygalactose transaminase